DAFTVDSRIDGSYEPPAFSALSDAFTVDSRIDGNYGPPTFSVLSDGFTVDSRIDGQWTHLFAGITEPLTVDNIPPAVEILDPNGGEVITDITAYPVNWSASDASLGATPVSMSISVTNGGDYYLLDQNVTNDAPEFVLLPRMNTYAARMKLTVTDRFGNSQTDTSDDMFTILGYTEGYSRVYGWVTDVETGEPVESTQLQVYPQSSGGSALSNANGAYQMFLPYGNGYEMTITRPGFEPVTETNLNFGAPEENSNFTLYPLGSLYEEFRVIPVSWLPNPDTLKVPIGGTGYAWYIAEGRIGDTWTPVPDAMLIYRDEQNTYRFAQSDILPYHLMVIPYHFSSTGLVAVPVRADYIDGTVETFTIVNVNNSNLSAGNRQSIEATQVPLEFTEDWGYRVYRQSSTQGGAGSGNTNGFAGGGAGAVLRLTEVDSGFGPEATSLTLIRRDDLFSGMEMPIGPPALISTGIVSTAAVTASFPYQNEYEMDLSQPDGLRAALTIFLFSEPLVLYPGAGNGITQITTSFLSWLAGMLITHAGDLNLETLRTADEAGLDVSAGIEVEIELGSGGSSGSLSPGGDSSLGNEFHLGGSLRATVDGALEKKIYLTGAYDDEAFIGPQLVSATEETADLIYPYRFNTSELPAGLDVSYELKGSWQNDVWQTVTLSAGIESSSSQLNSYDLGGSSQEYRSWFRISDETVLSVLMSESGLSGDMSQIGAAPVQMTIDNDLFSRELENFLTAIYDLQESGNQTNLIYGVAGKEKSDMIIDRVLEFPLSNQPALTVHIGNGIEAATTKSFNLNYGRWVSGLPYFQYELTTTPQSEITFQNVFAQLWEQLTVGDLWSEFVGFIQNNLQPTWITSGASRDHAVVPLNDRGSQIILSSNALPDGVDSVLCRYWEWTSNLVNGSMNQQQRQQITSYVRGLRNIREQSAGLHYGIGGFFSLEPQGTLFTDSTWLSIQYSDSEIVDYDETALSLFWEDSLGGWHPLNSTVHLDSNRVTALIPECRTYTLAPRLPQGYFELTSVPEVLPADGSSVAVISSSVVLNNDSTVVSDGTLVTVSASGGTILNVDEATFVDGIQLSTIGGVITFQLQSDSIAVPLQITAVSQEGYAMSTLTLEQYDVSPPDAPALLEALPMDEGLQLTWQPSTAPDLAGYFIWFDSDTSGAPYDGTASVWGQPSPVQVGKTSQATLTGLTNGVTYYAAVTAFDIAGVQSELSNELQAVVTPYQTGDVNQDGNINVTDVVQLVWIILNDLQLSELELSLADMTGDGDVNISDIVELVYIILSQSGREWN
ncbi:MAG: hypothetical protein GXO91_05935, partial [FCB group bacterium]|nr:hypothetical protein [FCB group bacterium]